MINLANWGLPQWIIVTCILGSVLLASVNSGYERGAQDFEASLIAEFLWNILLLVGGFFDIIRWPQIVWVLWRLGRLLFLYAMDNGEKRTWNLPGSVASELACAFLLLKGGFFM